MAQLTATRRISREEIPDAPEWLDQILTPQNAFNEQVHAAISGTLTIADNTTSKIALASFTHGVEKIIKNPLPSSGRAAGAIQIGSDGLPIASVEVRNIQVQPEKSDVSQLGVTVRYHPPFGFVRLRRDANQAMTDNTTTAINWDTQDEVTGDSFTHSTSSNPSQLVCVDDGVVEVSAVCAWAAATTSTRQSFISINGVTTGDMSRYGENRSTPDGVSIQISHQDHAFVPVAAGDYLELQTLQISGGPVNVLGAANSQSYLQARYAAPLSTYSANATILIFGG